jgi:galactose mutarotase-like enzyme
MSDKRPLFLQQLVEYHSVDMRQFIDFRQSTLPTGSRIVEAYNSSGLTFTLLPDRGLDIWLAHYISSPLTWISQGSPHAPDFGLGWLQQFNGGLLVTCGLSHVGPPETDPVTGETRDLHGQFSRLRAQDVNVIRHGWNDERYEIELRGVITEASLFGPQLRCERSYRMTLGEPEIRLADRITNLGDMPMPLMLLYHFNFGYPTVTLGTKLITPYQAVYPRDDRARVDAADWENYAGATPGYEEQVFFHHLKHESAGNTRSFAALANGYNGIMLEWDTRDMPYLTQWKNTREGLYVCGVEPGNCIPEGQIAARRQGRLVELQPGESRSFGCTVRVLPDAEAVQAAVKRADTMQKSGTAVENCHLDDYKNGP